MATGHCQPSKPFVSLLKYVHRIAQFAHYTALLSFDPALATLVKGVINNEARYVAEYPYCTHSPFYFGYSELNPIGGAFQPPPESGLAPTHNDYADGVTVSPCVLFPSPDSRSFPLTSYSPVNNLTVFECKVHTPSLSLAFPGLT